MRCPAILAGGKINPHIIHILKSHSIASSLVVPILLYCIFKNDQSWREMCICSALLCLTLVLWVSNKHIPWLGKSASTTSHSSKSKIWGIRQNSQTNRKDCEFCVQLKKASSVSSQLLLKKQTKHLRWTHSSFKLGVRNTYIYAISNILCKNLQWNTRGIVFCFLFFDLTVEASKNRIKLCK